MRIAMIGQKGMPAVYGGVEQHVHELSVGLVRHGHDVTVYARPWYTQTRMKEINGVRIAHLPSIRRKHFDTITHTLLATIHALWKGADVIHYHGVGPALLSFLPRILRPKTRVIATFHSIDRFQEKWGWIAKKILKIGEWMACRAPHATIVVSKGLAKYCRDEYGREALRIPSGADPADTGPSSALAPFGLSAGAYIAMIARLVPRKGAHVLVQAFLRLKQSFPADPVIQKLKLAIVGGSVDNDSYVEDLQWLANGCADIAFTGFVSGETLSAIYKNAAAVVHPSFNEGLPITVLTAMKHGTPVLVSDIPEHLELVTDPRCLFRENDAASLAETLARFLALPDKEKAAIAERNRLLVETEYNWDGIIPRIVAAYEQPPAPAISAAASRI